MTRIQCKDVSSIDGFALMDTCHLHNEQVPNIQISKISVERKQRNNETANNLLIFCR